MVVIKFRQDLFHYGLTIKYGLCPYPELLTITIDCSHFVVIQIYNLSMASYQRRLLLFKIFGIDAR